MTPCERLSLAIRYLREFAVDGEQETGARGRAASLIDEIENLRREQFDPLAIELSIVAAWRSSPPSLPKSLRNH